MRAPDTSVLVAGLALWHETHPAARAALEGCALIAQTQFEVLSVLTRLPEPHRVDGSIVVEFLRRRFTKAPLQLTGSALREAPAELEAMGIRGGAVYDGLIAVTARQHGLTLVTLDSRATVTYHRLGVAIEPIAASST